MDADMGLPKATVAKMVKEALAAAGGLRAGADALDRAAAAANEFVALLSAQANEASERDKKSTVQPEHVTRALEELGFAPALGARAAAAWAEWKDDKAEADSKARSRKDARLDTHGMTQEQLVELQQRLFAEAREKTCMGAAAGGGGGGGVAEPQPAGEGS